MSASFSIHVPAAQREQLLHAPAEVRSRLESHLSRYAELASAVGADDVLWVQVKDPLSDSLRCDVKGWGVLFRVEWAQERIVVTEVEEKRPEEEWRRE